MRVVTLLLGCLAFNSAALASDARYGDYNAPVSGLTATFMRLQQHILDLEERLAVQFEAIHDHLDALDQNEPGSGEVR